jgi:hypothetical protein
VSPAAAFTVGARASPEPAAELAVVVACHNLVCALPVRHVERLFLREEVELRAPAHRRPAAPAARLPQVVYASGEPFAAWNLGSLLELPPVSTAWVLMRIPVPRGGEPDPGPPVAIALRTGPCLVVQPMPAAAALPPGLFRARGEGIVSAFATSQLRGKRPEAALGLSLDPTRLLAHAELERSRAAVAAEREEPQP